MPSAQPARRFPYGSWGIRAAAADNPPRILHHFAVVGTILRCPARGRKGFPTEDAFFLLVSPRHVHSPHVCCKHYVHRKDQFALVSLASQRLFSTREPPWARPPESRCHPIGWSHGLHTSFKMTRTRQPVLYSTGVLPSSGPCIMKLLEVLLACQ